MDLHQVCRRKKIRCDGLQPGRQACTNCITYGHECKFEEAAKRRAPPRAYVEALEARMEKVERLLAELAPGVDFTDRIGPPVVLPEEKDKDASPKAATANKSVGTTTGSVGVSRNELAHSVLPADTAEREKYVSKLGGKVKVKNEDSDAESDGSYSGDEIALVQTCERPQDTGADFRVLIRGRPDEGTPHAEAPTPVDATKPPTAHDSASFLGNSSTIHLVHGLEKMRGEDNVLRQMLQSTRPDFWRIPASLVDPPLAADQRENQLQNIIEEAWPPIDLEHKLVDIYFTRINHDYPILSEGTFRAELNDPNNRRNSDWVMLAMALFAVASRYTDDERVLDKTRTDDSLINTRGSKFYGACRKLNFSPITPSPSLRWIQMILMATIFIIGTSLAQNVGWSMLGVVFRALYFAGAHRKLTAARMQYSVAMNETWRRTWWVAYSLEREMSTMLGRPAAVQDEDFDVESPLEVDDKYLIDGEQDSVPTQPASKPAGISGFVSSLKLDEIMGRTLRTIYAIGKAKVSRGLVGKGWDQFIVAEIDSSLNQWLDTVPKHLRYNPSEKNDEWLLQSSMLYCKYYYCQILVHRPFIAGPKMSSALNFPSLSITTNAAKSTVQILYNLHKRQIINQSGHLAASRAFEAGCVLLVVVSGSKKNGLRVPSSTIGDIKKCLEILRTLEDRWALAGKLTDLLTVLCNAFNVEGALQEPTQTVPKRKASVGAHPLGLGNAEAGSSSDDILTRPTRNARRSEQGSTDDKAPLPLSTKDLGLSPTASDPVSSGSGQTPRTGSPGSHFIGPGYTQQSVNTHPSIESSALPDLSHAAHQIGNAQHRQAPLMEPATTPSNDLDFSVFANMGLDTDQEAFASFVNGLNNPAFTPLDLPSFSSAFLTQAPGSGPGGIGGPYRGPVAASNGGHGGQDGLGGAAMGPALTPGLSNLFAGSYDDGVNSAQGSATQQPQSQASSQHGVPSDPFNNVFRDLWASQNFYSSQ